MTTQRSLARVEATNENANRVLSLITDLIFVSIATSLLVGYARTLVFRPVTLLVIMREVFLAVYLLMGLAFLAVRRSARVLTSRKRDYLYTILGFGSPLLFQSSPFGGTILIGALLEASGLAFVASAFLCLNRSFGLAPENRGVKTAGAYSLVRHPMYLGYILAEAGFVFDNFSNFNLFVLMISVLFLLLRLGAEEQFLGRDRDYRDYSRKTRWKLIPFIY